MDEAVNTGKEYCGLERCEDCVNYNNCKENMDEMMEARRAIYKEAKKHHAYFSLKVNCDYFKRDKSKEESQCQRKV